MAGLLRGFYDREVRPLVEAIPADAGFVLILGTALLANKRYLADDRFGGPALMRWQALAAWLVGGMVLALGLLLHRRGRLPWWLPGLLAAGAMVAVLVPGGFIFGDWRWALAEPERLQTAGMLGLALLAVAPAALGCRPAEPRLGAGLLIAASGVAAAGLCLSGFGPLRELMLEPRVDKLNWGLLTAGWLLIGCYALCWPVLGGRFRDDGGGLGRWRFWLPWTLGLLLLMVLVILLVAGRSREFLLYYPMYRTDWPFYNPYEHGWGFYVAYTLSYGAYFAAWEFFFRGWMLFRLEKSIGGLAVVVQTVPFVIMHIGKPGLEFHSSLVAGLVLGWLAWRSRSFWPCALLHWAAAATMDLVALYHGLQ